MVIKSLKLSINKVYNDFAFGFIDDIVRGEGGDGWAWIVCKNPHELAEEFVQKNPGYYIADEDLTHTSVNERHEQSFWYFTTNKPNENDLMMFDFVFELE